MPKNRKWEARQPPQSTGLTADYSKDSKLLKLSSDCSYNAYFEVDTGLTETRLEEYAGFFMDPGGQ